MVKVKRGMYDRRTTHRPHHRLPNSRGDCIESCQQGDEQRTAVLGQTHAEFHVGKFGQRTDKIQVCEFTDPQSLLEFMDSNQHSINYVSVLTEDRVEIHYRQVADDRPPSINLNILIATFTTCLARLRLYEALHLLQERVLYFDTDSVIYIQCPSDPSLHPPRGNYFRDFKMNWPQTTPKSLRSTMSICQIRCTCGHFEKN